MLYCVISYENRTGPISRQRTNKQRKQRTTIHSKNSRRRERKSFKRVAHVEIKTCD